MSSPQNSRLGILLMIATSACFAVQDAITLHLGSVTSPYVLILVRFWFMTFLGLAMARRSGLSLREAVKSRHPWMQIARALMLISEICLMVFAFLWLGLIETHAVFVCYPLLVTMLSGPLLGEKVGWRRWLAVLVGFIGVLIILQPGSGVFSPLALMPFGSALIFAVYSILTRKVADLDPPSVSFFWTGFVGALVITPFGLANWQSMGWQDWSMLAVLCALGGLAHWLLIKAYDMAEASAIQPFAYLQLPFTAIIGVVIFHEALRLNVVTGAAIVVAAGLFTFWRQRLREKQAKAGRQPLHQHGEAA